MRVSIKLRILLKPSQVCNDNKRSPYCLTFFSGLRCDFKGNTLLQTGVYLEY